VDGREAKWWGRSRCPLNAGSTAWKRLPSFHQQKCERYERCNQSGHRTKCWTIGVWMVVLGKIDAQDWTGQWVLKGGRCKRSFRRPWGSGGRSLQNSPLSRGLYDQNPGEEGRAKNNCRTCEEKLASGGLREVINLDSMTPTKGARQAYLKGENGER